jgi:hypothetical protein
MFDCWMFDEYIMQKSQDGIKKSLGMELAGHSCPSKQFISMVQRSGFPVSAVLPMVSLFVF